MATRLPRIGKTSSLVFPILASHNCHSSGWQEVSLVQTPGRDGHFFLQTNKRVDIYMVAGARGSDFIFRQQTLSLDLALVRKVAAAWKLLKILLKIVKICTCDDEIIVNVTCWKYSALPLTILLILFYERVVERVFELDFWRWVLSSVDHLVCGSFQLCWSPLFQPKACWHKFEI